jgi:hypothetical protein
VFNEKAVKNIDTSFVFRQIPIEYVFTVCVKVVKTLILLRIID